MTAASIRNGTGRQQLLAGAILLLILSLSAFIQFSVVTRTVVDEPLRADASEYFSYAYNLSHFGIYSIENTWSDPAHGQKPTPDNIRPPGYPLFLLLAGSPEPTAQFLLKVSILQATLGVLSVWLSYLLAARVMGAGFALIVALLTAISPHAATMSTYLLTETLFLFLLLASTLALLVAIKRKRISIFVLAGGLWGLTCLVRSTAFFFPILLVFLTLLMPRLRPYRKEAFATLLAFLTVLSPWVIRNQSDSVQKPGSSLLVKALSHGSYPNFMYEDHPATFGFPYAYDPRAEMATRSLPSVLGDIAGKFRSQPGKYFKWFLLGKPYFFLSMENVQGFDVLIYPTISTPYYEDVRFAVLRWLGVELHLPLMMLGVAGLLLVFIRPAWLGLDAEKRWPATIVALLIAYAIIFHMIVAPFPRYAIPFRPCIYVLGVLVLQALWLKFSSRNQAPGPSRSTAAY